MEPTPDDTKRSVDGEPSDPLAQEIKSYQTYGWTRNDIRKILRHACGAIDRAIILIMASSGVRINGMELKWRDIVPIYDEDGSLREGASVLEEDAFRVVACAKLRVYADTPDVYVTFITPEAYEAVQDYLAIWADEAGRVPEPDDPFIKKAGLSVAGLTSSGIRHRVYKAIRRVRLRGSEVKKGNRYLVSGMKGFRRFFYKALKDAASDDSPTSSMIKKECMLGHTELPNLDAHYRTNPLELAKEYLNAVPNLTIYETRGA